MAEGRRRGRLTRLCCTPPPDLPAHQGPAAGALAGIGAPTLLKLPPTATVNNKGHLTSTFPPSKMQIIPNHLQPFGLGDSQPPPH
ncbi:MAG: hypothetical protein M1298_00525, partial [Chloroflexi bacterium]|nr:hypothetical protein [Chloroflexota bacterium]